MSLQNLFIFGGNNCFFAVKIDGIAVNLSIPFFASQNGGALGLVQSADHALLFILLIQDVSGDVVIKLLFGIGHGLLPVVVVDDLFERLFADDGLLNKFFPAPIPHL